MNIFKKCETKWIEFDKSKNGVELLKYIVQHQPSPYFNLTHFEPNYKRYVRRDRPLNKAVFFDNLDCQWKPLVHDWDVLLPHLICLKGAKEFLRSVKRGNIEISKGV